MAKRLIWSPYAARAKLGKSIKFDRFAFSFAPDLNDAMREAHSM
jgi:hypothetical protein